MDESKLNLVPSFDKKKNNKIIWVLVVVLILAIIFVFFRFNLIQNIFNGPTSIPSYFLPKDVSIKNYKVSDSTSFVLRKGEEYQAGKSYEVNKPYKDAVNDVISLINQNKWSPINGTTQDQNQTILKINNGVETLFIVVNKITEEKSQVIFIPVKKQLQ